MTEICCTFAYANRTNENMDKRSIGLTNGIIAGISFGLIPLFSIPVIADGMGNTSILAYRFLFGCLAMLTVLLYRRTDMHLRLQFSVHWNLLRQ